MKIKENDILAFLERYGDRKYNIRDIAKKLEISQNEYRSFRRMIKNMILDGKLGPKSRGKLTLPIKESIQTATISITRSGRAFAIPESGEQDFLVSADGLGVALDRDLVKIRLIGKNHDGRINAEVIEVLERRTKQVVGTFKHLRFGDYVEPDNRKIDFDIKVSKPKGLIVENGMKVVVALLPWDDANQSLQGKIIKALGFPGEAGVDILSIIEEAGLETEFSAATLKEADEISTVIPQAEIDRRLDLRKKVIFTIDPADAKDHDDAISIEKLTKGYRLGVHIADVSHYIQPKSHLDKTARLRCFSAYLSDRVIPMLPEKLSNNICSLKEKEDRLTVSAFIDIGNDGEILSYKIADSIICSKAKLSYSQVQEYFETGIGFEKQKRIASNLTLMRELAMLLIKCRLQDGSIDIDLPEYKVILDEIGLVEKIEQRYRIFSNRLVEDFMLIANKIVAEYFLSKNLPTLYRIHPPPNQDKIDNYLIFARNLGYKPSFGSPPKSKHISRFMKLLRGKPEETLLSELLVRSMQKAIYQPENIGHFGLAFNHYLHFTSPIRRYADLMVHRILKSNLSGSFNNAKAGILKKSLKQIGRKCSEQESIIMKVEMFSLKIKQAEYLSKQLGEVFKGVVSGIIRKGFFVKLLDIGTEGLVVLSNLHDDFYDSIPEEYLVKGRKSGRQFRLGDKVMVQVVNVDRLTGEIDLHLVEDKKKSTGRKKTGRVTRRRRR